MAAYAALASLMNTVDAVLNHPRLSTSLDYEQTKSLLQKANFLLHFVENSHAGLSNEDLESQIASAAHSADVVIEFHMTDLICAGSKQTSDEQSASLQNALQKIMEEDMDSIMEKVIKAKEEPGFKHQQPTFSEPAAANSSRSHTAGKTSMVGFDPYLHKLLDWLTREQSHREIIPITGMGGIGKTTLARKTYEHSLIVQHFDVRAWVTVSQVYSVEQIISETLSCLRGYALDKEKELGVELHKFLFGRRYLIILDDMWSIGAWEKVQDFFPENDNGSRIIVTTRQTEVANYFGSLALALNLLDDDNCWHLFCEKAFAQEDCPPELERIGRNIVKNCRGLPLSIVVIGGLLAKSSKKKEYWENVEKDLSSIIISAEDNLCLNVLSLSYSYLPAHLKPCFLYLGTFREDWTISVGLLIKLWVAEGFLRPKSDQSLEEVGEGYVKDLVDRSLILVHELRWDNKFVSFKVHDLLRELCIKIDEKEKFFFVISRLDTSRTINRKGCLRVTVQEEKLSLGLGALIPFESTSLACQLGLRSELLRVLFKDSLNEIDVNFYETVSLRFLDGFILYSRPKIRELPSSICLAWNLQTLFFYSYIGYVPIGYVPSEIWDMPQLRHVHISQFCLPDPPLTDEQDHVVLRNLQTLVVSDFRCTDEVCKRMPNVKRLQIRYSGEPVQRPLSYYCLYNIGRFNKLESLYCNFRVIRNQDALLRNIRFPSSLKELTLECKFHWDDLTMIGWLPQLEYLQLSGPVTGSEWNPIEGEFLRLKFLELYLYDSDLISWNADSSHFPILEVLRVFDLNKLDEIPPGIGEIPTLRVISLHCCSASLAISVAKMLAEQESLGNESLKVVAIFEDTGSEVKEVREKVEADGFPTNYFLQNKFEVEFNYFDLTVRWNARHYV